MSEKPRRSRLGRWRLWPAIIGAVGAIVAAVVGVIVAHMIERPPQPRTIDPTATPTDTPTPTPTLTPTLAPTQVPAISSEPTPCICITQQVPPSEHYFNVYTDAGAQDNHFAPSGYMGDIGDIAIDESWTAIFHSGNSSIRVEYDAQGRGDEEGIHTCMLGLPSYSVCKWAGVYWQDPPNNWGEVCEAGYDLTGFKKITFWAYSDEPVAVQFKVGGIGRGIPDRPPCPDSLLAYPSNWWATLGPTWTQYEIALHDADLSHVIGGLAWVINWPTMGVGVGNPKTIVFYLDDIRYER